MRGNIAVPACAFSEASALPMPSVEKSAPRVAGEVVKRLRV